MQPEPSSEVVRDLEFLRSRSLTSVLQAEIEKIILSGALGPGERLNEKALAERFDVSRGPVREACRALAARGLVKLIPNRGVFIREINRHEAEELYDVRAALFGTGCRLLAERVTVEQIDDMKVLLARMDAAGRRRDIDAYYPVNLEFHRFIMDGSGNATLARTYRDCVDKLHLYRERGLVHGGGFEVSNQEHGEIVAALERRDPRAAFEAGYQHVAKAKIRTILSGDGPEAAARAG